MKLTVPRLHELDEKQLLALGALLRGDIKPESTAKDGSTWACQRLMKPGFWDDAMMRRVVELDKGGKSTTRVALDDGVPVGATSGHHWEDSLELYLFSMSLAYSLADQWAIADAIAIAGMDGDIKEGCTKITGWFPEKGQAADYARRVGMKGEVIGKPMVVDPNPLLFWSQDVKEMRANVEALQKAAHA